MLSQNHMPLYEFLKQHSKRDTVRYHIPGHQGGELFELPYWKKMAKWDVTESFGMDDLHAPYSIIKEAEQLAAEAFGADKTFFLVNGTSCGLLASIHALFKHGDTVLVQRNAHKSIYNGMLLLGLNPTYLMPERIEPETIAGVVTPETLQKAILEHPEAKGIIITSPTYYGLSADIKKLAQICKQNQMLLLVDEAHGAHYMFHPKLKGKAAIHLGADIVVQSIHKTLPAMTMGSMLHISHDVSARVNRNRLAYYISVFQTTSPSYIVMASLDFARHWVFHNGYQAIERAYIRKRSLCEKLERIGIRPWDTIWEQEGRDVDPLKVTLPIDKFAMNSRELEQQLASKQIYIELISPNHILLLLGLGMEACSDERLLSELAKSINTTPVIPASKVLRLPSSNPNVVLPFSCISREIHHKTTMHVSIEQCAGKVAAEFITPYPPGIPLLCPGELITNEHIEYMLRAKEIGIHFQGLTDKELNMVQCYTMRAKGERTENGDV